VKRLVLTVLAIILMVGVAHATGDESCCGFSSPGNPYLCYGDGNCTWWAWYKRPDLPAWSGDASTWLTNAVNDDIPTGLQTE